MPTRPTATHDLVAIGRAGVDLYGVQVGGRLEDMATFAKYLGGSPANTAAGAARLGLKAAMLTRVGDDPMGRFVREQLAREGVDVSHVATDPGRLTALVVLGIRDHETFPLVFYRENCADMALGIDDVDEDLVGSAHAVVLSGTHLTTPQVYAASVKAARLARAAGRRVAFDVDYRPVLWGLTKPAEGEVRYVVSDAVTRRLQEVAPLCDVIVGTEEEFHILGGSTDTRTALANTRATTGALLVCKLGARGCMALEGAVPGDLREVPVHAGFPVEVFNVLGAGDAFMAGFLRGWLRGEPLDSACRRANACGAIVVSRHGCSPAMPTEEELEAFLAMPQVPLRLREDARLEHLHWATTRAAHYDELAILAVDHRSQFEELAREVGAAAERISGFKALALEAVHAVAGGAPGFGVLLDGRFGADTLARAAEHPYWVGRPIELPKSCPLDFEGAADVAVELAEWPVTQVVKCLVFWHPDDAPEMRERQGRQLSRLFAACRHTRHELLLEVIAPKGARVDDQTAARSLRQLYDLGLRPDWWKLEPAAQASSWTAVSEVIAERDPHCRGVVLLGLAAPEEALIASFNVAAAFPVVKGFAVGRTIFHETARRWLAGGLDDRAAVDELATRFRRLVEAWRRARLGVGIAA